MTVHLLVVCTSERGLCGGFNSSIARFAREDIRRLIAAGKKVKIICVGKKGYDILRREFASLIVERVDFREVKKMSFAQAELVASKVFAMFDAGEFDVCTLYYSEFKSVISQVPTAQQLIPASPVAVEGNEEAGSTAAYDYEPDASAILADLAPRSVKVQIFRALLENVAGEMGAKMSAMDNATRNAGEMIDKLSLSLQQTAPGSDHQRTHQIISGAEAL